MNRTLISVAILTKDNPNELKATLDSVYAQTCLANLQILIVQSWSDNRLFNSIITPYINSSVNLDIVVSYPPCGIYPAMNLALEYVNSELMLYLNSGDTLHSAETLRCLMHAWRYNCVKSSSVLPLVFGRAKVQSLSPKFQFFMPSFFQKSIDHWLFFFTPNHQTVLFSSSWAKLNPYPLDQGNIADRTIIRRALSACDDIKFSFADIVVSTYFLDGISSSPPTLSQFRQALFSRPISEYTISLFFKLLLTPFWSLYPLLIYLRSLFVAVMSRLY